MNRDGECGQDREIEGCILKLSSPAAPEAYDVFKDGLQIGYLRLRWGKFKAYTPHYSDIVVYEALLDPTESQGGFNSEDETILHLTKGTKACIKVFAAFQSSKA